MSEQPVLFGAHYSVYTRIVYGALLIKGVPFSFSEIDVFDIEGKKQAIELGNPFGKIPILKHNGLVLYETRAILSYLDNSFDGANLYPLQTQQIAVSDQLLSIADNYIYPNLVWKLYVPFSEGRHDEVQNVDLVKAQECLNAIEKLLEAPWACGNQITATDLYLEANLKLFLKTPFAEPMLRELPKLKAIIQVYQTGTFFQNVPFEE